MRPTLSTSDVAAMCGTTDQHIRKLARQRRIPHVRVGGVFRYDADEITSWLAGHRVTPEETAGVVA